MLQREDEKIKAERRTRFVMAAVSTKIGYYRFSSLRQLVLENVWAVYDAVLTKRDKNLVEKITSSLNLKILPRDARNADPRVHLQAICGQWLPLADAALDMVCFFFRFYPFPRFLAFSFSLCILFFYLFLLLLFSLIFFFFFPFSLHFFRVHAHLHIVVFMIFLYFL